MATFLVHFPQDSSAAATRDLGVNKAAPFPTGERPMHANPGRVRFFTLGGNWQE
jgi:hypothetical protein